MRSVFLNIISCLLTALLAISFPITAHAAGSMPPGTNTGWIRAKLTYEYDEGVEGLSDHIIDFADGWSKTGDWFYYNSPVKPGSKVRFITGFDVPAYWTEAIQNKNFQVVVTVEVSEVPPSDFGWDNDVDVMYREDFDLWSLGIVQKSDMVITEGKLTVDIHEYQLDGNGKEVPYVNNKLIVPGQHISKIVEFELGGKLGSTSFIETVKKEVEKIKVIEIIKTGQETYLLMGLIGLVVLAGGAFLWFRGKGGRR